MNINLKTIYGLIMLSKFDEARDLFSKINPEWNNTEFFERLYKAFDYILGTGKIVDPIEILNFYRSQGWFNKTLPIEISKIVSSVPAGSQIYLNSILGEIDYTYQLSRARFTAAKINELIESDNFSIDRFTELLEKSKPKQTESKRIASNTDLIFDVIKDHDNAKAGIIPGIEIGLRTFNKEIVLEPVDVMVIGARPAMGKTAFSVTLAVNMALRNNLKVAFFSLEMSNKQIMRRIVSNIAAIDSNRIKFGECSATELKKINQVQELDELDNIKIFEGSHSIKDITSIVSELKRTSGVDVIIIDYLQKIIPRSKGSRYEQVTEVSNGVKMIAQNMHVPVIALAQLSRNGAQIGKLPTLTDLKESGEIEQDASIVTFLHRPEYYGEEITSNGNNAAGICEVLIAKNREGSVGKYELGTDLSLSKFYDLH
jgi:replicative DNA helicase